MTIFQAGVISWIGRNSISKEEGSNLSWSTNYIKWQAWNKKDSNDDLKRSEATGNYILKVHYIKSIITYNPGANDAQNWRVADRLTRATTWSIPGTTTLQVRSGCCTAERGACLCALPPTRQQPPQPPYWRRQVLRQRLTDPYKALRSIWWRSVDRTVQDCPIHFSCVHDRHSTVSRPSRTADLFRLPSIDYG